MTRGSCHTVRGIKWANYSSGWFLGIVLLILNIIKMKQSKNKDKPFLQPQETKEGMGSELTSAFHIFLLVVEGGIVFSLYSQVPIPHLG